MSISRWRLGLTAGAIVVLASVGVGLVSATSAPPADPPPAQPTLGEPTDRSSADAPAIRPARARLGRHVVHAVITLEHPREGLITVQVDRGTLEAIGSDSITIAEATDTSVTVATNDETRVRKARQRSSIADLRVGDTVWVVSRIPDGGGEAVARWIVVPQRPAASGS